MKLTRATSILLAGLVILIAETAWSKDRDKKIPFEEANIFIEFNSTDIDTGIQVFLDADNWQTLTISDPRGRKIVDVSGKRTVRQLGLSELFFESVEPEIADLPLVEFLAMFPEGQYEFKGVTVDSIKLKSEDEFTHAIPCGPVVTPADGTVVSPSNAVVIEWGEVTEVVDPVATDEAGEVVCTDPAGLGFDEFEIETYEVIVNGLDVTLPATARQLTLPTELILPDTLYGFEVLAKEGSGNQTITAGFFCTGPNLTSQQCIAMHASAP